MAEKSKSVVKYQIHIHFMPNDSLAMIQMFPQDVRIKLKDAALCTLKQTQGKVSVLKMAGRVRPSMLPYLAPEVLLGHRPRRAADTYAFGILMWELYTGACACGNHVCP